jgi:hypothetical protein
MREKLMPLLQRTLPATANSVTLHSTQSEPSIIMADKPDPNKLKGPGGLTLQQIYEQVQKSVARDRETQAARKGPAQPQSRWQRVVRYVWGRSGRR